MAKLSVTLQKPNIKLQAHNTGCGCDNEQIATLHVADLVVGGVTNASDLISQDTPNNLKLGSDGKLLASAETITKTAINQAIGSYRAVIAVGENGCDYANTSDVSHFDRLLGLTTHAAAHNANINILRQGELSDTSWSFIANKPVFVTDNGLLTQTPVTIGFNQQIGVALTPTKLLIKLYQPILLN